MFNLSAIMKAAHAKARTDTATCKRLGLTNLTYARNFRDALKAAWDNARLAAQAAASTMRSSEKPASRVEELRSAIEATNYLPAHMSRSKARAPLLEELRTLEAA